MPDKVISLRLSEERKEDLEKIRQKLNNDLPYTKWSTTEVIQYALYYCANNITK